MARVEGEWRAAGGRTKLLIFDASVLLPALMCVFVFHWITIGILLTYAALNAYVVWKGRSTGYFLRRARFWLRGGVVKARPAAYWRQLRAD